MAMKFENALNNVELAVVRYHFQMLKMSKKSYFADFQFNFDMKFLFKEFSSMVKCMEAEFKQLELFTSHFSFRISI